MPLGNTGASFSAGAYRSLCICGHLHMTLQISVNVEVFKLSLNGGNPYQPRTLCAGMDCTTGSAYKSHQLGYLHLEV